jgi:hypothetical protein
VLSAAVAGVHRKGRHPRRARFVFAFANGPGTRSGPRNSPSQKVGVGPSWLWTDGQRSRRLAGPRRNSPPGFETRPDQSEFAETVEVFTMRGPADAAQHEDAIERTRNPRHPLFRPAPPRAVP